MLKLQNVTYLKLNTESVDQNTFDEFIKVYREFLEHRDSPLPLYSNKYYKNLIFNSKSGDNIQHYYYAKQRATQKIISILILGINLRNNKHICFVALFVQAQYRKQGIGKNFIKFVFNDIPDYVEKVHLYVRQNEITEPFTGQINLNLNEMLTSKNGKHVFTERRSICDITSFTKEEITNKAKDQKEKVTKKGYSLIFVNSEDLEKSKYFDFLKYVKMMEDLTNDEPREDSAFGDIQLDPELYLSIRKHFVKDLGQSMWTFIAIHDGEPVGMTETWFSDENPTLAIQADTGVVRNHRGNGLGLALKYQMLNRMLLDKSKKNIRFWVTSNANSNKYMININNILKYEEKIIYNVYEFDRDSFEII